MGGAMKKEGGPPAWSGAGPDGWAGLPVVGRAQRLLLLADALAPGWGCAASFPGRSGAAGSSRTTLERSLRTAPSELAP